MTHDVFSVSCRALGAKLPGLDGLSELSNRDNRVPPSHLYQSALEATAAEVIIYVHDDVTILDRDWLSRVLAVFERPEIAVVGLGGAPGLGLPSLYKRPYFLNDMARWGFRSNLVDWYQHGVRETGSARVAVIDQFFMAVSTTFLRKAGGWPISRLTHHCMDMWVCCEAARQQQQVWIVGAECAHRSDNTSQTDAYKMASWLQGGTLEQDHALPHRWIYEEYRDVLPIVIDFAH